jgi:hypothetical protein
MRLLSLCVLAVAFAQVGATDCNGGIIRDPGYDLWCGNSLCAWKVVRGEVVPSSTWHSGDLGVWFTAPGTTIEQFTPVDSYDGTCIRFDLVGDVDETAQLELDVDVYGDGTIERSFVVPTTSWKPISFRFAVEPPFTGIRFEFTKSGPGEAVLARMHAQVLDAAECADIAPIRGGPAPLGAICGTAADCASQICPVMFPPVCAGCDPLAPMCADGKVCGRDDPGPAERAVPLACVDAGARVLGEQCFTDAECATGVCELGVCSTCRTNGDCGGAQCGPSYSNGPPLYFGPRVCRPGQHAGARGVPCGTDGDCASGTCLGAPRLQCSDGRSCASDSNCPVGFDLIPGTCSIVGVQGGTCG